VDAVAVDAEHSDRQPDGMSGVAELGRHPADRRNREASGTADLFVSEVIERRLARFEILAYDAADQERENRNDSSKHAGIP
jgi:hypothetical protein